MKSQVTPLSRHATCFSWFYICRNSRLISLVLVCGTISCARRSRMSIVQCARWGVSWQTARYSKCYRGFDIDLSAERLSTVLTGVEANIADLESRRTALMQTVGRALRNFPEIERRLKGLEAQAKELRESATGGQKTAYRATPLLSRTRNST